MPSYTKLKRDYELKNGNVSDSVEIMYNSIDNSIAYDYENDTYIINKKTVDAGRNSFDMIYDILSYELNLLGLEHFNKLINQYGDFAEFWLNELEEEII